MKCPNCGSENNKNYKYCINCGAKLKKEILNNTKNVENNHIKGENDKYTSTLHIENRHKSINKIMQIITLIIIVIGGITCLGVVEYKTINYRKKIDNLSAKYEQLYEGIDYESAIEIMGTEFLSEDRDEFERYFDRPAVKFILCTWRISFRDEFVHIKVLFKDGKAKTIEKYDRQEDVDPVTTYFY